MEIDEITDVEQKTQETYQQLEAIEQYMKNLQQQTQLVEQQYIDLVIASKSIEEFVKLNSGNQLKIPLSSGIFIDVELKDTKNVFMNVGADVVVQKKPEDAKHLVDTQLAEVKTVREKLSNELERLAKLAQIHQHELQKLLAKVSR